MLKPRKEAEKLEEAKAKANAITNKLREEAKGIIARTKMKTSAMMAQVLRKIPLINKMMINWAKQAPEDRQATEDVLDAMARNTG